MQKIKKTFRTVKKLEKQVKTCMMEALIKISLGQSGARLESGNWIVCALVCSSLRRLNTAKCLDLRIRLGHSLIP